MTSTAESLPAPGGAGTSGQRPWLAVLLMATAMLCFTALDSMMRALYATQPLSMLVFVRNLVQVAALSLLVPVIGPQVVRTKRIGIHALRGAFMVLTTVLITLSLSHLPMAQTYSITFSTPLIATILAALMLGERPRPAQWLFVVIGFAGVVVVLNPQDMIFSIALLYPLGMATANAVLYVLTRYAGRNDGPLTLVFWASLVALTICLVGLPFYAVAIPMTAWLLLGLGGVLGTLGHLMIAAAFRRAPTAVVSPMLYTQIVWATLIGWLVFEEVPTTNVMIGSVIVIASGIAVLRLGAPDRR